MVHKNLKHVVNEIGRHDHQSLGATATGHYEEASANDIKNHLRDLSPQ